jgi:N-methylhydantoinase A
MASGWGSVTTNSADVRVGIDIGGTFTDLLVFDARSGRFAIGKTLTTPDDPSRAVVEGLATTLTDAGLCPDDVGGIVHGTTLVTNALIERKGARTALITTKGFRDAVEIGREHRYDLYDLFLELPPPLAPRHRRFELDERVLADGSVVKAVGSGEVRRLIERLVAEDIEAVAVSLLHAYRNPAHERQVEALLHELAPSLTVSLSSDVAPEIREFERTSTTLANVYVRPLAAGYLEQLERSLRQLGVPGRLLIMLSSGGIGTVETARRYPIRLVESGPAAGALAAAEFGRLTDRPDLLSFDMGGTTAKLCLIENGEPRRAPTFEVARVYRFKKGSGLPISVPVVEMIEIGAGGGSIARLDTLGLLKVGPDSAGAEPGPACYGRGGERPTVTDADLVLGYLDPGYFLGGRMALDVEAARQAIQRDIAEPLEVDLLEAAWGVHQVVNEQMASAARIHAIEHGEDPRAFPLFAFGGAGPVHAFRVGAILGTSELIVPLGAGVASTVGFLAAPLAFDFVRSYYGRLDGLDWAHVNALFAEMEHDGRTILREAGVADEAIRLSRTVELRYVGQGHEVPVPLPDGALRDTLAPSLLATFEETYRRLYERIAPGNPVEALTWRVVVAGPRPTLPLDRLSLGDGPAVPAEAAIKGERPIFLPEARGLVPVPVYDRYRLGPGASFAGPAVVEERESTLLIGPGASATIDELRNVVVAMPR